jgi:signal recognition particle subunit SRP19
MAQHARIEELSDSTSDSDPPEDDLSDYAPSTIPPPTGVDPAQFSERYIQPALSQKTAQTQRGALQPSELQSYNNNNNNNRSQSHPSQHIPQPQPLQSQVQNPPEYKSYQAIYPLYFDASRTRSEGRRVGREEAVANPLAREIVDAVQMLGLKTVFEPAKTHPKDWSNPGRVRVLVKENGRARTAGVKNSMLLYSYLHSMTIFYPIPSLLCCLVSRISFT